MNPRRIGLLHGGALGDFVLCWHLFRQLARAHPHADLVAWARAPVAATDPRIWGLKELHDLEACGLHALFADAADPPPALIDSLAACDLILNCLSDDRSTLTKNLRRCANAQVVCLDTRPDPDSTSHITEQWAQRLRRCAIPMASITPSTLALDPQRVRAARDRLIALIGEPAERIVLIHPGSGGRAKCWPLDNFLRLADRLQERGRDAERVERVAFVVFVVGPVEKETLQTPQIAALQAHPFLDSPPLTDLIDLIASADLAIGNDSGFSHLAATTVPQTTVLALFGASNPAVWRPLGANATTLGALNQWPSVDRTLESALNLL